MPAICKEKTEINMNKLWIPLLWAAMGMLYACEYSNEEDVFEPSGCAPGTVSFAEDIEKVINANCAVAGCHVSGNQFPPLETHQQIAQFAAQVRVRTSNGTMPPASSGKSLTVEEIEKIACWVENGAPDN
jgi:uncharacterized membrane protein